MFRVLEPKKPESPTHSHWPQSSVNNSREDEMAMTLVILVPTPAFLDYI